MQYSQKALSLSESSTLAISALSKKLAKEGREIIDLSIGEPDFDTPRVIKDEAIRTLNSGFTKYTAVSGILELKVAICKKLESQNNLSYTPDEIIVSNGAKHSLFNAFGAILNPQDEVIIPAPYWVTYPQIANYNQATSVVVQTDKSFKITPKQLKEHITPKTKMLILNSPSNPTGAVYSKEELIALGEVLKGTQIWVISDEIYEALCYVDGYTSTASVSNDLLERTITINGLSKSMAMTGWRMGYLASKDSKLIKIIDNLQSNSTSNINSITQKASIVALSDDTKSDMKEMKSEFIKRRNIAHNLLNTHFDVSMPDGAFYLFVDISKSRYSTDCMAFCSDLLEKEGVALVPGEAFGYKGYVRLSFATSIEKLRSGIEKIINFAK